MKKLFSMVLFSGTLLSVKATMDLSQMSIPPLFPNPTQNTLQLLLQRDRSSPVAIQRNGLRGPHAGKMDGGIQGAGIHSLFLDDLIADLPSGMHVARVLLGETSIEHKVR